MRVMLVLLMVLGCAGAPRVQDPRLPASEVPPMTLRPSAAGLHPALTPCTGACVPFQAVGPTGHEFRDPLRCAQRQAAAMTGAACPLSWEEYRVAYCLTFDDPAECTPPFSPLP